ncbi:hypothetical protein HGB13_00625 [bacterium]|nr:hypothetical protein [bacterium]
MSTAQQKINEQVMEKLDSLTKTVGDISISLAKLPELMADKFDERYASKRTEVAVDRLAWLVVVAVVGAVLVLVIK